MIEINEAVQILVEKVRRQNDIEVVSLLDSTERILAENIYSDINVPDFPKSAMDGYALRSIDTKGASKDNPIEITVIEKIYAGDFSTIKAGEKTAVRLMTGSFIPEGYDSVIKQELTNYGEHKVEIYEEIPPYNHYCPIGEDVKKGDLIFSKGTKITSTHLGILASIGRDRVPVFKSMKVSLISTGSELLKPGNKLEPGKIFSSTNYIIASNLLHNGIEIQNLSISSDDIQGLSEQIVSNLEESDILLTTGGVSVGDKDLMPDVMKHIGAEILFHSVAMKPGTPVLAASYKNKLLLCFSGNPYASLANFNVLFWPVASAFYGSEDLQLKRFKLVIEEGYLKKSRLTRLVRAKEKQGKIYLVDKVHKSSVISNMVDCNVMVIQRPNTEIKPGEEIEGFYLP